MASFFRRIILLTSIGVLTACVQNGHAPGSSGGGYDGVDCDYIVEKDMTGTEFLSHLQDGTAAAPFYVCIASGVNVNAGFEDVTITNDHIFIQGNSNTTSTLSGMVAESPNISLRRVKLIGSTVANAFTALPTADGNISFVNSNISFATNGISMGGAQNISVTASKLTFTPATSSTKTAFLVTSANDVTASITDSDLTVGAGTVAYGIRLQGSNLTFNIGDIIIRSKSTDANSIEAININHTSSGSINYVGTNKSLVCNMPGSASTFSNVYSINGSATFPIGNFQNASNASIGTCP